MINRDIGVRGWDQSCLGLMALPLKTPNSEIVCGQNMPNIFFMTFMGVVLFISLFQYFHYQVQSFSEQYLRVQENTVKGLLNWWHVILFQQVYCRKTPQF